MYATWNLWLSEASRQACSVFTTNISVSHRGSQRKVQSCKWAMSGKMRIFTGMPVPVRKVEKSLVKLLQLLWNNEYASGV